MKLFVFATLFALGTAMSAQDAEVTLPDAYTLQFENQWVKVVRVHYAPYAKLPAHAHTKMASAYVYLSDSGPVIFRHIGAEYGSATRAAVKAGTFRLWRAIGETHEVENTSELASDFLRVEFKTEPREERTLKRPLLPQDGARRREPRESPVRERADPDHAARVRAGPHAGPARVRGPQPDRRPDAGQAYRWAASDGFRPAPPGRSRTAPPRRPSSCASSS